MSDFLLNLRRSLAHKGFAKILEISMGMPAVFANPYASRSQHISSQKIAQLRLKNNMLFLQENPQGIFFKVFVQPKSSKNMITGIYGDAIKIKLTAPPVDGAANKMCIKFLAKCLKVPKTSLEIISGHTSRTKYVLYKQKYNNKDKLEDIERFRKVFELLLNAKKTA